MNFGELYGEALSHELGSSDRTLLFTTARRKAALNEAALEFVRLTDCLTRDGSIALSDGVAEYDLESSLTDFWRLAPQGIEIAIDDGTTVTYYSGDDGLPRRDIVWLNRHVPGWRAAPDGKPISHYIRQDAGQLFLGVYPAPDIAVGETWTWTVPYVCQPSTLSADADQPFTTGGSGSAVIALRPYHQALVHYAAAQLEKLRKNTDAVTGQLEVFMAFVTDYLQRQRPRGGQQVSLVHDYATAARHGFQAPAGDPRT